MNYEDLLSRMDTENYFMKDSIHVRIDSGLKEKFRQVAGEQNPGLPKSQAMSAVVREMIVSYVKKHQRGGNLQ